MQTAISRRSTIAAAVVLSVAAHLGLVAGLTVYRPMIHIPDEDAGPPFPIIPILMEPRALPPPPGGGSAPRRLRLHRRPVRIHPEALPVPPLVTAAVEAPAPAAKVTAPVIAEPVPAADPAQVRAALKGLVGCASPATLTREERETCDRRLAAGGKTAPPIGLDDGSRDRALAAAIRRDDYRYKPATVPPGAYKGMGQTAEGIARDSQPTARIPF